MAKTDTPPKTSTIEQEYDALLQRALARPGFREAYQRAMQAYKVWQEVDQILTAYRRATRRTFKITATDHANPDDPGGEAAGRRSPPPQAMP